jgi:hypothetical protein
MISPCFIDVSIHVHRPSLHPDGAQGFQTIKDPKDIPNYGKYYKKHASEYREA